MASRKGIFRRITEGVRRILGGGRPPESPPRPPEPPPRESPREPPRRPDTPPPRSITEEFRDIWDDTASDRAVREAHERTGHSETEIFQDLRDTLYPLVTEESRNVQLDMWKDFIEAFVNDNPAYTKNDFFADWDVAPSSFEWEAWRQARGYGKK